MASNVSMGKKAEARAIRIFRGLGYGLVARAKNIPVWKMGRVVANDGDVDLAQGSVDLIFRKRGSRTLYVQVTHLGSESPRRAKLRAVDWDTNFEEVLLLSWDAAMGAFHVFRDVDDWLKADGWHLAEGDGVFPWAAKTVQMELT